MGIQKFRRRVITPDVQTPTIDLNTLAAGSVTFNDPVHYRAAYVQNGIEGETAAMLAFSYSDTNAPSPVIYDDTAGNGSLYAVASFTNGQSNWVQDHFKLATDWSGDSISLDILWRSPATTGNVTWECQCGSLRSGSAPNLSFNTAAEVTTTVPGTTLQAVSSSISALIITGINAGDEVFFKLARSASDTAADVAELISIDFHINRTP
jgi:hypothetical protein